MIITNYVETEVTYTSYCESQYGEGKIDFSFHCPSCDRENYIQDHKGGRYGIYCIGIECSGMFKYTHLKSDKTKELKLFEILNNNQLKPVEIKKWKTNKEKNK